jgi:WD40 repeat protein
MQTIEDESSIRCVAISPDGKLAAACDSDGYCYVWSMPNASTAHMPLLHKIKAHQSYVLRCTFSPNSQYVHSVSAISPNLQPFIILILGIDFSALPLLIPQ